MRTCATLLCLVVFGSFGAFSAISRGDSELLSTLWEEWARTPGFRSSAAAAAAGGEERLLEILQAALQKGHTSLREILRLAAAHGLPVPPGYAEGEVDASSSSSESTPLTASQARFSTAQSSSQRQDGADDGKGSSSGTALCPTFQGLPCGGSRQVGTMTWQICAVFTSGCDLGVFVLLLPFDVYD